MRRRLAAPIGRTHSVRSRCRTPSHAGPALLLYSKTTTVRLPSPNTSLVHLMRRTLLLAAFVAGPIILLAACEDASPDAIVGVTAAVGRATVAVCHYDADANAYHRIGIADMAIPAHRAHGDAVPGEAVPTEEGYYFSGACVPLTFSLEQLTPFVASYATTIFVGTGTGDVTGKVTPVDINLAGDRFNTSGCEASDFAGFPAGDIALIQRGACDFMIKALNAQAAGAAAVVIFNQGDTPDRMALFNGTIVVSFVDIPVVAASFDDGVALAQPGSTARVHYSLLVAP